MIKLFQHIRQETFEREYKEMVISFNYSTEAFIPDIIGHRLPPEYANLVESQIIADLYRYVPKYISCFFNSQEQPMFAFYYGVTDDGQIIGIPYAKDHHGRLFRLIHNHIRFIIGNHVRVVLPNLDGHICEGTHVKINYLDHRQKWREGHFCSYLSGVLNECITVKVIVLDKKGVTPHSTVRIRRMVERYDESLTRYQQAHHEWERSSRAWIAKMNFYSGKIADLLADTRTTQEFIDYAESRLGHSLSQLSIPNSSSKSKERASDRLYRVGENWVPEEPFFDLFRGFRDHKRERLRRSKPVKPVRPRNPLAFLLNRVGVVAPYLIENPKIDFLSYYFKFKKKPPFPKNSCVVYSEQNRWRVTSRRLKTRGDPECI
jgi:hypothetical protein